MAEERNNNHCYKCPHCPCIFLTVTDLQKHMSSFGDAKGKHKFNYRKLHRRLEHDYSEE